MQDSLFLLKEIVISNLCFIKMSYQNFAQISTHQTSIHKYTLDSLMSVQGKFIFFWIFSQEYALIFSFSTYFFGGGRVIRFEDFWYQNIGFSIKLKEMTRTLTGFSKKTFKFQHFIDVIWRVMFMSVDTFINSEKKFQRVCLLKSLD